jgi:hypothetical protein
MVCRRVAMDQGETRCSGENYAVGVPLPFPNFNAVSLAGEGKDQAFRDEKIPDGFAPFKVQELNGNLVKQQPYECEAGSKEYTCE